MSRDATLARHQVMGRAECFSVDFKVVVASLSVLAP